jgi:hypothetical protein
LQSDRLFGILIANASEIHFGQGVPHYDLHILYYDLGYIHPLTLKIKEDIEFQIGLIIKLNTRENVKSETETYSPVLTPETDTF